MNRNVHFLFDFIFCSMDMLTQTKTCHSILSFFFFIVFFLWSLLLYFWWYCVFIYSKVRQFEKSDIVECFKLLNTGEGRGFCLVSWHLGHGAPDKLSRTGYMKQCTEKQPTVLILYWFSCSELFYQVWLVTLKYTLIWLWFLKVLSFYFSIFNYQAVQCKMF